MQVGQAALLGQMTTGFPVSPLTPATFLLVGLCRLELADHQRFAAPCLFAASLLMVVAAIALRSVPAVSRVDPHRLRRRLLRRSHRTGRGAGRAGSPRLPGVRVPGRAHHRAGAAAQGARSGAPATIRCSRTACAPCCRPAPPGRDHRHQHGRGQSGRGRRRVRGVARELGLAGLPVAAITGDDVLDVVTGGGFTIDETGAPVNRLATRSSRPTPTSAPRRLSRRWPRAPASW